MIDHIPVGLNKVTIDANGSVTLTVESRVSASPSIRLYVVSRKPITTTSMPSPFVATKTSTSDHKPLWASLRIHESTHWLTKAVVIFQIMCLILHHSASLASATETCTRHIHWQTIRHLDCRPKRIMSFVCSGTCSSYVSLDGNTLTLRRTCRCCRPLNVRGRDLMLRCPDPSGARRYVTRLWPFQLIRSCQCRPCTQLSGSELST